VAVLYFLNFLALSVQTPIISINMMAIDQGIKGQKGIVKISRMVSTAVKARRNLYAFPCCLIGSLFVVIVPSFHF